VTPRSPFDLPRTDNPAGDAAERLLPLQNLAPGHVLVHEIFASIQGESSFAGFPCTFVRTAVCHLRCRYCDTIHAYNSGTAMTVGQILTETRRLGLRLVEVTGGEPLLQHEVLTLLRALCDAGHDVLLETSGSLDVGPVDPRVVKIVDMKPPSSGEVEANLYSNLRRLQAHDEVKLVLGDRADYLWARDLIASHLLPPRCRVLLGTVFGELPPADLAAWILEDRLDVRLQLQMHKYVWDPGLCGV
jgi:7-carboxy-7-deazaguanine synthase